MATLVTKTIGSAVGRDYSTISAWFAACPASLVAVDQVWKGECYNDSVFNETVNITGITIDSNRYVWLSVATGQSHNGTLTGGVVINRGGAAGDVLSSNINYTIIEGFRITNALLQSANTGVVNLAGGSQVARRIVVHSCVLDTSGGANHPKGIAVGGNDIYFCIVANLTGRGYSQDWTGIDAAFNSGHGVWNCIVYNVNRGISVYASCAVNCIVSTPYNDYLGGAGICFASSNSNTSKNNISTDATAIGAIPLINKTDASLFTNSAGGDFTTKAGSPASGAGIDVMNQASSGGKNIQDIAYRSYDVGAFQTENRSRSVGTRAVYNTGTVSSDSTGYILNFAGGASIDTVQWGEGDFIIFNNNSAAFSSAFSFDFNSQIYTYVHSVVSSTQIKLMYPVAPNITGTTYSLQRAYSTFQTFAANCPINLITANIIYKGIGYNDSVFIGGGTFNSITTDLSRFIWVTVASGHRHNGKNYSTSGARIEPAAAFTNPGKETGFVMNNAWYSLVEWWQISAINLPRSQIIDGTSSHENMIVRNNILYAPNLFYMGAFPGGINSDGSLSKIYNNIVYGKFSKSIVGYYGATIYNNTIYNTYGTGIGIRDDTNGCTIKNNISFAPGGTCYQGTPPTASNNLSGDATAPGASSLINKVDSNQFACVVSGFEDFTLRQAGDGVVKGITSDAISTGINLATIFDSDNRSIRSRGTIKTGTINSASVLAAGVTNTSIVGTGTLFLTELSVSDIIILDGYPYTVATITDNTNLTINYGFVSNIPGGIYYYKQSDAWDMGARQHSTIMTKTIGTASRDYSTIVAWAAAVPSNLLLAGQIWKGVCYKDGTFAKTSPTTVAGTTQTDSYMWLTTGPGQRHTGVKGTGVKIDSAGAGSAITAQSPYMVIDGLEITNFANYGIVINTYGIGLSNLRIFNNLIYEGVGGIAGTTMGLRLHAGDNAIYDYIYNNIIYGCSVGIYSYSAIWGIFVIGNSITGCAQGFSISTSVNHITINNIIVGNTINYYTTAGSSTFWVGGRNAYESNSSKWYSTSTNAQGLFQKFMDTQLFGTCTVTTGTKTVTWVSGSDFSTLIAGDKITIGSTYRGNEYTIATKTDSTHLIVSETMTAEVGAINFVAKYYNIDTTAAACFSNITLGSEDLRLKSSAPIRSIGYGSSSSWYNASFQTFALGGGYYLNGPYSPPSIDAVVRTRSFPTDLGALLYYSTIKARPPLLLFREYQALG